MKTRLADDRENYNLARQEAERVKRIAKQESFEQIGNDLETDFDGAKKLIYHMAKNYRKESQPPSYAIKDENGEKLLTEPRDIELRWRNHFENLLYPPDQDVEEYEVNYKDLYYPSTYK